MWPVIIINITFFFGGGALGILCWHCRCLRINSCVSLGTLPPSNAQGSIISNVSYNRKRVDTVADLMYCDTVTGGHFSQRMKKNIYVYVFLRCSEKEVCKYLHATHFSQTPNISAKVRY